MALGDETIGSIAGDLYDALQSGDPIEPPTDTHDADVADAYAIQSAFVEQRVADGASVVGHKIGLTNDGIQEQLGVDAPDFGRLLDVMRVDDGVVDTADLIAPRVEPELGFLLGEAVTPPVSSADVLQATDAVVPVVEVIDSRVRDWEIGIEDTVADNASSALFAVGSATHSVTDRDLSLEGVKFQKNGEVVDSGVGAAVLGHPAQAVAWLAETLADLDDELTAGELVLSGSITPAVDVEAGDVVTAEFGSTGSVTVGFE